MTTRLPTRIVLTFLAIVFVLALQQVVFGRLPLPGGRPSLLLVFVVAVALAGGSAAGVGVGFTTGLLADALTDHPLGVLALVFMVVGLLVGTIEAESERSVFWSIVVVAIAAVGSFGAYAVLLQLVDNGGIDFGAEVADLPSVVLYDVMLTPFVVPVVAAGERAMRSSGRSLY